MWTVALEFLGKYWKIIGFVLIISAMATVIHFKEIKIESQAKDISSLNTELTVAKRELAECQGQIDHQNKAIEDAAKDAQTKKDAIDKLAKDITALKDKQKIELQTLRNKPAPKNCDETTKYLQDNLEELKKW
jgi:septal ring factor EnvC (AmiA/AmiB activator)